MGIVIRQAFWVSFLTYLGVALGYVSTFILFPLFLSVEEIGLIRLSQTNGMFLIPIVSLGMTGSIIKFYPQLKDKKEIEGVYILAQIGFVLLANLAIIGLILVFLPLIEQSFAERSSAYLSYIYVSVVILISQSFYEYFSAYFRAHYNIIIPNYFREVHLRLFIMILILLYGTGIIDFRMLMLGISGNYILTTLLVAVIGFWKYPFRIHFRWKTLPRDLMAETWKFGGYILALNMGSSLILNLGSILTSTYLGLEANGIFSTCLYLATVIEMPKRATSQITSPFYASKFEKEDMQGVNNMYSRSSLNLTVISLLIFIGIVTNLDDLFLLIPQGEVFSQGFWVVVIIAIAKVISMVGGTASELMIFSGYRIYNFYILIISGVILVISNVVFIPIFGISGAAISLLLVVTFGVLARFISIKMTMKLSPWSINHMKALAIGLGVLSLMHWLPMPFSAFWSIVVRSILTTVIFGSLILLFHVSAEATALVQGLRKKAGLD